MTRQIRKGYDLSTIIDTLKSNGIELLTLDFKTTNEICEYKCDTCSHEFKTSLKFKFGQIKKGKIGCPVCSKKEQVKKYIEKDPLTGKSKANINAEKSAKTMKENGTYALTGDKIRKTVTKKVDNVSIAKLRGEKTKKTRHKIDIKTGKTSYELGAIEGAETSTRNFFKKLVERHQGKFKILNTVDDYIMNKKVNYECCNCNTLRTTYQSNMRCLICNPYKWDSSSTGEIEVLNFCKSLNNNVIASDRNIILGDKGMKELDIYIPDKKLAIEYNGMYWHCDAIKNSKYHLDKTKQCDNKDIRLMHIFECDWNDLHRKEIWKSNIRFALGLSKQIDISDCVYKKVSIKEAEKFSKDNHLSGNTASSINLGLYYNDELVSLMKFNDSRYIEKWELSLFCNILNYEVIDSFNYLLDKFRELYDGSIIGYIDRTIDCIDNYVDYGFVFEKNTDVDYWWYQGNLLENSWNYTFNNISKKLKNYNSSLTVNENMYQNNFVRIYDCGKSVMVFK